MVSKPVVWAIAVVLFISILLLVILLPLSYSLTQLNEYSLYHSRWSEVLTYDSSMAESGRHFTGLAGHLIKFPRTKCLIEFREGYDGKEKGILKGGGNSLQAWTKEGANVYLEASYYFSINKEKMLEMYQEYGAEWLGFIVRLSFSVLKSTTVLYQTSDFVSNSNTISNSMKDKLAAALKSNFSNAIVLDSFYLQKVSFDDVLDNAINAKLVQAHKKKSYEYQRTIATTRKDTELAVLQIDNQIRLTTANTGDGPAIEYEYTELGAKVKKLATSMNTAYKNMDTTLAAGAGYTSPTDIWKYFYVTELKIAKAFQQVTFLDNAVTKTLSAS